MAANTETEPAMSSKASGQGSSRYNESDTEGHPYSAKLWKDLTLEERLICTRKNVGFSSSEIASQLRVPVAKVNWLFRQASRKLRQ
jgi:hypothetical protein